MYKLKVRSLFKDKHTGAEYRPGTILEIEDKTRVDDLVSRGLVSIIEEIVEDIEPVVEEPEEGEYPKHVGGGWYDLPDGTRVQGKENAEKLMERDWNAK